VLGMIPLDDGRALGLRYDGDPKILDRIRPLTLPTPQSVG